MPDVDPYVSPPSEPVPQGRLGGLRPWLTAAIVILLALSIATTGLVEGRQDPSLELPDGLFSDQPTDPDGLVPVAPTPDNDGP